MNKHMVVALSLMMGLGINAEEKIKDSVSEQVEFGIKFKNEVNALKTKNFTQQSAFDESTFTFLQKELATVLTTEDKKEVCEFLQSKIKEREQYVAEQNEKNRQELLKLYAQALLLTSYEQKKQLYEQLAKQSKNEERVRQLN
jgi:hypothetical protein